MKSTKYFRLNRIFILESWDFLTSEFKSNLDGDEDEPVSGEYLSAVRLLRYSGLKLPYEEAGDAR